VTPALLDSEVLAARIAQRNALRHRFLFAPSRASLSEFVTSAEESGLVQPISRDGAVRAS